MNKNFWKFVRTDSCKDTRKYHYKVDHSIGVVYRIKLEYLGTTEVLDLSNWEPCHLVTEEDFK